jgi:hypothetical protein
MWGRFRGRHGLVVVSPLLLSLTVLQGVWEDHANPSGIQTHFVLALIPVERYTPAAVNQS